MCIRDSWAAMLFQGVGMVFLFTAMHECSHSTAFRSRWLNHAVGMLAGLTLLIGPKWFFYFHQDHHKFTQDPDRDPELGTPKPSGVGGYLAYLSGIPFWVSNMQVILGNATGRRSDHYVPEHMQNAVRHEARLMMLFYLLAVPAVAYAGWLMHYLVAPLVIGAPFLRAYLLAEHAGCDEGDGNMLANTRTLLTTAPVRFIAWNMPYHTEHHSFPAVPFHALPRLHRFMRDDIRHLEPGYLSFHREFSGRLSPPSRQG